MNNFYKNKLITILMIILGCSSSNARTEPIRILNWWDYMAGDVNKNLGKRNSIHLETYRSNDVAISRLVKPNNNYDIAIVSNSIVATLSSQGLIEENIFLDPKFAKRKYQSFFIKNDKSCVPYMWSTTVFAVRSRKNVELDNFSQLFHLSSQGYRIGIIDDKLEVAGRLLGDGDLKCKNQKWGSDSLESLNQCNISKNLKIKYSIRPSSFINSVGDFMQKSNSAVYGWIGELAQAAKNSDFKFHIPKKHPVFGYDSVCIVKRPRSKKRFNELVSFISELTNKKNTAYNVRDTQYFSPYIEQPKTLSPKFYNVLRAVQKEMDAGSAILLNSPSKKAQKNLNIWWRKIRYD